MAFQGFLKQSTAVDVLVGPFVDESDGKTAETGLTIAQADVRLSKNGQNMAQKNDSTSCAHDEIGMYNCELDATDTNTVGQLTISIHESGALPVRLDYHVVEEAVYDAMYGGTAAGPLQSTTAGRTLDVTANGEAGLDFGNTTGTIDAAQLGADCITAAKIADDAIAAEHIASGAIVAATLAGDCITADKIADDAIAAEHIAAGAIVAATLAGDCITSAKIADDAIAAEHIASGAIVAATLAADCITAAKIADDAIAAEHIAAGAIVAATLAADCITSAKIADDAIAAEHIASGAIVAATFASGAIDAAAIASDAITSNEIADGAITAAKLGGDCITAAKIADDALVAANFATGCLTADAFAANALVAATFASSSLNGKGDWNTTTPPTVASILTTQMTESYSSDGAAPTLAQSLFLIQQALTEFAISSSTITIKKVDGSTTAATLTIDSSTSPTSATRAS